MNRAKKTGWSLVNKDRELQGPLRVQLESHGIDVTPIVSVAEKVEAKIFGLTHVTSGKRVIVDNISY